MTKDIKQSETINPAFITTEEALADFLARLGFRSRPYSKKESIRILREENYVELPPQRFLFWQDNEGFEWFGTIVSIENEKLRIYYYEEGDDNFSLWEEFSGEVAVDDIKKAIRSAVTRKDIYLRVGYFWPERLQKSEYLILILENIGLKAYAGPWPPGLPKAGESAKAPHCLIPAQENGLDTDALVSVEGSAVYIYFRHPESRSFQAWGKLQGEKDLSFISKWGSSWNTLSEKEKKRIIASLMLQIKYSALYNAILSATTAKKEKDDGQ